MWFYRKQKEFPRQKHVSNEEALKKKRNKKENYIYYQKWTAKITEEYNERRSLKEFENDGTQEK